MSAVVFAVGDVVRVRQEEPLSVVVLPTGRPPDRVPGGVPDVGMVCCVPVALVEPVGGGDMRWVQVSDLTGVSGGSV